MQSLKSIVLLFTTEHNGKRHSKHSLRGQTPQASHEHSPRVKTELGSTIFAIAALHIYRLIYIQM